MTKLMSATIKWHDEPDELATFVAIDPNWSEENDDLSVFYYFESEEELNQARKPEPNGFEFQIMELFR